MKKIVNGVIEMISDEELDAWGHENEKDFSYSPTDAERLDALEEAIRKGMSL